MPEPMIALSAARLAEIEDVLARLQTMPHPYPRMLQASAAIRDLLAELRRRREWPPIETAPENDDVLVFCPDADEASQIMICHFLTFDDGDPGAWYEQNPSISSPIDVTPTHWMPLPEPPDA